MYFIIHKGKIVWSSTLCKYCFCYPHHSRALLKKMFTLELFLFLCMFFPRMLILCTPFPRMIFLRSFVPRIFLLRTLFLRTFFLHWLVVACSFFRILSLCMVFISMFFIRMFPSLCSPLMCSSSFVHSLTYTDLSYECYPYVYPSDQNISKSTNFSDYFLLYSLSRRLQSRKPGMHMTSTI